MSEVERTGLQVLPFYIVCDESASMDANGGLAEVNKGLPELHAAIASDPLVSDKCRVAVIAFSDTAEVLMPLSKMNEISDMPAMESRGMTLYSSAFKLLKSQIEKDVAQLKADGFQVHRPAVFFISDGEPTETDWETSYRELTEPSNPLHPNVVSFGVAGATAATIGKVGTVQAFLAEQNVDPGKALKEILRSLTNSIVSSSSSSEPALVVPPPPPGTVVVPLQTV